MIGRTIAHYEIVSKLGSGGMGDVYVIDQMFAGLGPDLLGVCEIENDHVLQLLADDLNISGRNYQILPHASPDARGIDVGFIFDANVLAASDADHQVVLKRNATRDLFWATFH